MLTEIRMQFVKVSFLADLGKTSLEKVSNKSPHTHTLQLLTATIPLDTGYCFVVQLNVAFIKNTYYINMRKMKDTFTTCIYLLV